VKTAVSVLLKLFISGNERSHTTDQNQNQIGLEQVNKNQIVLEQIQIVRGHMLHKLIVLKQVLLNLNCARTTLSVTFFSSIMRKFSCVFFPKDVNRKCGKVPTSSSLRTVTMSFMSN